ncbi:rod shape-determining protein MreD [Cricetibacter osteomyelitidis]|uniref:Rod shape-determining protein MreD n=1 Tax=Cricetibacter osteomyelitidis TaxID=1521931 RepID=A0A4R2SZ35_9PAST|nr:rod shape-determining protein MreD [Cricetibacter osteomyelitidis]TCP94990.1 rod shape-determining protein MreD [Cricetibacter osteomyelitidis]
MNNNIIFQWLIILCTFIIALVMEIAPWSSFFQYFRPAWVVMVLLYWILAIPGKVSIGSAFVVGILWDLVLGSILGVHALVLSVFAYLIAVNYLVLRNLSLWQQSLLVVVFVFAIRLGIFFVELLLHSAVLNWHEMLGALTSGLLWPWLFLLLRKIRRQVNLH